MAALTSIFKDTAIYGLSSIVGRFLNYLLVPLYTAKLAAAEGGYGVITNVYAYVALCFIVLTFGMEPTFFRFSNKEGERPDAVYTTSLALVALVGALFVLGVWLGLPRIADAMGYAAHPEYIGLMAVCVALDAVQSIPFARLRYEKRAIKFAALKLLFIVLNIGANLLYFVVFPAWYTTDPDTASLVYDPAVGVGYVFRLNLACTAFITLFFLPELRLKARFDGALARRMLAYSWPILILGIAGILNQTADKMIFPLVYGDAEEGTVQLGIYGASVKVAMVMAMITQAFRYAYEPFVFGAARDENRNEMYARAMKYFVIFTLLAYLCVMGYLDVLKYLIAPDYWEGLRVVPIVMGAEIMMGVYFNLSFWYKLTDRTMWGAWIALASCIVLLGVNFLFIPRFGYMACAWGGVAGYGTAMLLSYFLGRKYSPVDYPLKSIFTYVGLTALCYLGMTVVPGQWPLVARLGANTLLIGLFTTYLVTHDFPLRNLPVVGKYFRR